MGVADGEAGGASRLFRILRGGADGLAPEPALAAGQVRELLDLTRGELLTFRTRGRVQSERFGDSRSPYIGEGLEFAELRPFRPGDRMRHVHAASSLKAQELMVRKFTELREARVVVALDVSRSMFVRDKMRIALTAAGILAHSAFNQHMALGLWMLGGRHELEVPPRPGSGHFHTVSDVIVDVLTGHAGDALLQAYPIDGRDRLHKTVGRGALLFLISDFLPERDGDGLVQLAAQMQGARVMPVVVQDALEFTFPEFPRQGALVPLQDAESGVVRDVWLDGPSARRLRERHERRFAQLGDELGALGTPPAHLAKLDLDDIAIRLQEAIES
ncbi:MAG: DUF58 domain-containing protein [Acidobacteria bacterium]|nr:DUF58 domain-containing protein [Acidobacteriota bacterium]